MRFLMKNTTVLNCICPLCGKEGVIHSIEMLPKNGISMECIHGDGERHQWAEYESMEAVIAKNNRKPDGPKIIICPVCHKRGRVNDFHPDKARPDLVDYVVVHEKLRGAWGKNKAVRKRRRCYITKLIDREAILKKLGRYIAPTNNLERYIEK
jgi:hypothetical protein